MMVAKSAAYAADFFFCNTIFIFVIIANSFGICYTVFNYMPGGVYD